MDGREAHGRLVQVVEVQGDRAFETLLENRNVDGRGRSVERRLDDLEGRVMNTKRTCGAVQRDLGGARTVGLDDDLLTTARSEEAAKWVIDVCRTLDDDVRSEESADPTELRTGDSLQPGRGLRETLAEDVGCSVARNGRDNGSADRTGDGAEVLDRGDLRLVAIVQASDELLDEERGDVAQEVLDRLVLDLGVLDSDGALENANTLRVLVEDGIDVLGGPKRVLEGVQSETAN